MNLFNVLAWGQLRAKCEYENMANNILDDRKNR